MPKDKLSSLAMLVRKCLQYQGPLDRSQLAARMLLNSDQQLERLNNAIAELIAAEEVDLLPDPGVKYLAAEDIPVGIRRPNVLRKIKEVWR